MRTYLDTFFRHRVILSIPIIVGFLAGVIFTLWASREYSATSSIWVDTRVPAESSIGTTGGETPPAEGRAALLEQLLSTRSFLGGVVENTPIASDLNRANPTQAQKILTEVRASVEVLTPGPQLLTVLVRRDDADEAIAINRSVLQQFNEAELAKTTARAEAQVAYDKRRLQQAKQTLQASPNSRAAEQLQAEAAAAYQRSQLDLAAVKATVLDEVDAPDVAYPQSRRKTVLIGAVGGTLAGFTVSLLALLALMARDDKVRSIKDARQRGLNVVGAVPRVDPKSVRRHESDGASNLRDTSLTVR